MCPNDCNNWHNLTTFKPEILKYKWRIESTRLNCIELFEYPIVSFCIGVSRYLAVLNTWFFLIKYEIKLTKIEFNFPQVFSIAIYIAEILHTKNLIFNFVKNKELTKDKGVKIWSLGFESRKNCDFDLFPPSCFFFI
jgi:hypothetical protein